MYRGKAGPKSILPISRRRTDSESKSDSTLSPGSWRLIFLIIVLFVLFPFFGLLFRSYKRSLHIYTPHVRKHKALSLHDPKDDVDCVVYISYRRQHGHVKLAVENLRTRAGYRGPVYLITDSEDDWEGEGVTAVKAKDEDVGKMLKTKILDYTPPTCVNILYLDTDVLFVKATLVPVPTKSTSLPPTPLRAELEAAFGSLSSSSHPSVVLSLFLDSGGHAMGICKGCDRWHTGIIGMRRGRSESVLREWGEEIREREEKARSEGSDAAIADQAALDATINKDQRYNVALLGYERLLFMRDYIRRKVGQGEGVELQHYTGLGEGGEWESEIRANFGLEIRDFFPEYEVSAIVNP